MSRLQRARDTFVSTYIDLFNQAADDVNKTFVSNFQNNLAEYNNVKNTHANVLKQVNDARNKMNSVKTATEYKAAYDLWKKAQSTLIDTGCIPPMPPLPKDYLAEAHVVNQCHDAYLLGFSLGDSLGDLVKEVKGTSSDLDKQNKCLDQYVAYAKLLPNKDKADKECFNKGRLDAKNAQRKIAGNKQYRDEYNKVKAMNKDSKINYELGMDKYLNDVTSRNIK